MRNKEQSSRSLDNGQNPMGKSILIVEDEPQLLKVLRDKFQDNNYTVHTAKNGLAGLKSAKKHQPDIILLDLLMPKMRGLDMLQQLRQFNLWGKRVPVIILTNVTPTDDILAQVTKTEPSYYLVKADVKLDEVVEKVRDVLASANL